MNSTPDFSAALRRSLTGDPQTPLVIFGNIEVEERWARGTVGLPRLGSNASAAVVNRMDELALLLGSTGDVVVLKDMPDADLLADLTSFGFSLPKIVVAANHPHRSVTEDALDDPNVIAALSALRPHGHHIVAHGISDIEERIAAATGLPLAGPPSSVVREVNSKVYSRRLAQAEGITQPMGWSCTTIDEWEDAVERAVPELAHGPLVIKEGFGVSGKGLAVVSDERRLRRVAFLVASRARATGDRLDFCLERWLGNKQTDINYQFTVARDGTARFDFVKEALTSAGVHRGHRFPPRLTPDHARQIEDTAAIVARVLAGDGYYGVVGVDAMTTTDGALYPVVEINARHNMSTYQVPIQEKYVDGTDVVGLARHFDVRLTTALTYKAVRTALGESLFDPATGTGVVVHGFATVNAALMTGVPDAPDAPAAAGRLYTVLIGNDDQHVESLERAVASALDTVDGTT